MLRGLRILKLTAHKPSRSLRFRPVVLHYKKLYTQRFNSHSIRVMGTSLPGSRFGEQSLQQVFGFRPLIDLDTAIRRSQNYLLKEQKPEGYWIGELMVDSTSAP